jgi:hypothetical protein
MADAMKVWAMNVSLTTVFASRRRAALAFGVTVTVFASSAAWSQTAMDSRVGSVGRAERAEAGAKQSAPLAPPEAIPGAAPRAPAAPATKPIGDLQPNDALFDAINRGDIAAARDALNRGADLDAVNVLGMTPMALSVDLSRNDITFLLLSMRGEDSDRGSRALGRGPQSSGKTALSGKPASQRRPVPTKTASVAHTPVADKSMATPRRFANDGGTPLPSAGFLGFGSRSTSN